MLEISTWPSWSSSQCTMEMKVQGPELKGPLPNQLWAWSWLPCCGWWCRSRWSQLWRLVCDPFLVQWWFEWKQGNRNLVFNLAQLWVGIALLWDNPGNAVQEEVVDGVPEPLVLLVILSDWPGWREYWGQLSRNWCRVEWHKQGLCFNAGFIFCSHKWSM